MTKRRKYRNCDMFLSENKLLLLLLILLLDFCGAEATEKKHEKRQIFREQLLPDSGGKILQSAFHTDRLILNSLNKDGFSFPDGIVLDHRRNIRHPYPYQGQPETLKVILNNDGRFVSALGQYFHNQPEVIDTTYIIRPPIDVDTRRFGFSYFQSKTPMVFQPKIVPLVFPNVALFGNYQNVISNHVGSQARKEIAEYRQRTSKSWKRNREKFTGNQYLPSKIG